MKKRHRSKGPQNLGARIVTLENAVQRIDNSLHQLDIVMGMAARAAAYEENSKIAAFAAGGGINSAAAQPEMCALELHEQALWQDYLKRVSAWDVRGQNRRELEI